MKVKINRFTKTTSSGFVFLAPYGFSSKPMFGKSGSLILDNEGNPIWFRPLSSPNLMNTDFRVQQLYEMPVLTFWQGSLATPPAYTNFPGGSSEPGSCYYILNNKYQTIQTICAHKGYIADIHEFLLTPNNTALFLSTKAVPMNLTRYGGPKNGYVQDFAIQEVDVKTKKLLFFWNALKHIPLKNSYEPASNAKSSNNVWDAYHLNSIGLTDLASDILVSGRNTWTIYKINKKTKKIIWQLGGKKSNFTIEKKAKFSWQHDARFLSNNIISLFDDNSSGSNTKGPPSHGLELKLDFKKMTAHLHRSYYHHPNITVASQGNTQSLMNGNKFIGWGQSPYYSEFRNGGNKKHSSSHNLLYDAQMPGTNNYSYRAYRYNWAARPFYPPSVVIHAKDGQISAYVSWNGSTETARWEVFAGSSPKKLSFVASATKSGFETVIKSKSKGPYFQVKALDAEGHLIGVSKIVQLKYMSSSSFE